MSTDRFAMLPTFRLLLLVLIGAAILLSSGVTQAIWYGLPIYGIILVVVAIADWHTLSSTSVIEVERINDNKLSLGTPNTITLLIVNRGQYPLSFRIRDEFPHQFITSVTFIDNYVDAFGVCEIPYSVEPRQRGEYQFGDITIRYRSKRGFLLKQMRYTATAEVRVYPNLLSIKHHDIATRKGLIQQTGSRKSHFANSGTEFEHLRDYQSDDEFRQINWKATARRGKPIAATYETERSQFIISMIDTGRLMRPAINGIAKLDHIINTVLLLSYVTIHKGDQVGLLTFADNIDSYITPKRGKVQFHHIIESLYKIASHPVEADYARAITYLGVHHKRRSLVILFTDLTTLDAAQSLIAYTRHIARRHVVLCVTISDPSTHAITSQRSYTSDALYMRAVAEALSNERQIILDTLNLHGVLTVDVPANQLTTHVIQTYLHLKEHNVL